MLTMATKKKPVAPKKLRYPHLTEAFVKDRLFELFIDAIAEDGGNWDWSDVKPALEVTEPTDDKVLREHFPQYFGSNAVKPRLKLDIELSLEDLHKIRTNVDDSCLDEKTKNAILAAVSQARRPV